MDKIFQKLYENMGRYFYIGNCITNFEDDAFCRRVGYDATEMAQMVENSDIVSEHIFKDKCEIPTKVKKKLSEDVDYRYSKDNDLYIIYDFENDIHYFFSR